MKKKNKLLFWGSFVGFSNKKCLLDYNPLNNNHELTFNLQKLWVRAIKVLLVGSISWNKWSVTSIKRSIGIYYNSQRFFVLRSVMLDKIRIDCMKFSSLKFYIYIISWINKSTMPIVKLQNGKKVFHITLNWYSHKLLSRQI